MTILNHSTSAERERGLSWASDFQNASAIVEYGGALTGTPTFDNGITLDGTNDYITYNNVDGIFNSSTMSFVIKFTPNFATDENATRQFFDATNGSRFYIVKQNNANNNVLGILIGHTLIAEVPEATYNSAWKTNEENILVVTSTTGDTSAWLNGTQILTNDNTAWTSKNPTEFYIGSEYDGSSKFDGKINSMKVFRTQLTDQEALDFSNDEVYNYLNTTILDLPMDFANHDPTNTQTLDISGNGLNATFKAAGEPLKNTHQMGYLFDASDDDLTLGTSSLFDLNGQNWTIAAWVQRNVAAKMNIFSNNFNYGTNNGAVVGINANGTTYINFGTTGNNGSEVIQVGGTYFVTFTYDQTNVRIYVNGRLDATHAMSDVAEQDPRANFIGAEGGSGFFFGGTIGKVKVWNDKAITPLQVADLYDKEKFEVSIA